MHCTHTVSIYWMNEWMVNFIQQTCYNWIGHFSDKKNSMALSLKANQDKVTFSLYLSKISRSRNKIETKCFVKSPNNLNYKNWTKLPK